MDRDSVVFKDFLKVYNLPENSLFKRIELENALIDRFENLSYNKYKGWVNAATNEEYPTRYAVNLDTNYSIYSLYSHGTDYETNSIEDALMVFFIKYGREPKEGTDEYYIGTYKKILHDIINEVYEKEKVNC